MAKKITIYTTPICPKCHQAKQHLTEKKVKFNEIDLSENQDIAKKVFEKTKVKMAPIIEINEKFLIGYNKKKLDEALGE